MRFERSGRFEFQDTRLKRLALARKQAKERAAYPLFSDEIAAGQPLVDDVMEQRAQTWRAQCRQERQREAYKWRTAQAAGELSGSTAQGNSGLLATLFLARARHDIVVYAEHV